MEIGGMMTDLVSCLSTASTAVCENKTCIKYVPGEHLTLHGLQLVAHLTLSMVWFHSFEMDSWL